MTCHDADTLLHDALDRALDPSDAAALAAHVETCAACRDLQADLALVRDAAASLDRPILPAGGWQTLAARLQREGLLQPVAAKPRPASWRTYTWMTLAATLLAGSGVAIVWRANDASAPRSPIAAAPAAAPARGNARDPRAVEAIETELRIAAAHYEKAIAGLEAIVAEDRSRLDPKVAAVLERNLALIDTAIADSRTALQGQPGSLLAQETLFDAYRRKVTLLQDLIALASDATRNGLDGRTTTQRS
jgi:anti-sigma factor RsiW